MYLGKELKTDLKRITHLTRTLIKTPGDLPRYIRNSLLNPYSYGGRFSTPKGKIFQSISKTAIRQRTPWFSYGAIDFLEEYLKPNMAVFEWGSGDSTIFFSLRCRSIVSIEDDADWFAALQTSLETNRITNVQLSLYPTDFKNISAFQQSHYLDAIGTNKFDVIIIDGQDYSFAIRPICFERAKRNINSGGIIVVDDAWRYPDLCLPSQVKSVQKFEGIGPRRLGVTRTDVYCF